MHNKSVRIIIFFLLLLMGVFLALAGRCFYLQYYKGAHYIDVCIRQQRSFYPRKPQRGVILDRRGRVLAASNRIRIIFAEPRLIKDPKTTSNKLAPIVDMGAHEICKRIYESKNPGFAKIKADADENQASAASKIYGIGVQYDWRRHYPMGKLAAHVVGFTSLDNRGLGGIEFQYHKQLSGSPGQSIFFADVHRRPLRPIRPSSLVSRLSSLVSRPPSLESRDGCGIILTLDATIQEFARAELMKQYASFEAESALVIVAEPGSGAILAMVSLPDFDPGPPVADSAHPSNLRNRATTDQFEPGSIIKPIVAAIALDVGAVNKNEKIFCENGDYRGKGFGRIGEYRRGFGNLTVREILVQSSNIGMAKIGQRLGKKRLYEGLRFFGFGKKTGIDLPGEAEGLLRPASEWTGYSVTRIPFGQEISVTAVQLIRAFCILANGGHLVQPYLVKAVVDCNGKIRKSQIANRKSQIGYVIKPEVAKWIISDALTGVVNEGTGRKAKLAKWQVFGKTGTAQLAKTDGRGYAEDAYIASFVAGAPAADPAVIVLVSLRKPNVALGKGYTGGTVAAPVAAAILEKTLNYLEARNL
ncbi:MAG: peptidoglycan D,D-transpeptidase FtsI family protein [Sedimentisphaerales bacterium]